MSSDRYDEQGDYALYLWLGEDEDADEVIRSISVENLRAEGKRLLAGKRYKHAHIYKWDYASNDDNILIEEL